jgi:hypothetical protein
VRGKKRCKVQQKRVVQYMTNGLEILDEIDHSGDEISDPTATSSGRTVPIGASPRSAWSVT